MLLKDKSGNPVSNAINREVARSAIDNYIKSETGSDKGLKEIQEEMAPEDSEAVDEILDKYTESGLVGEAIDSLFANGMDVNAVAEEMQDQVSPEDMQKIMELYAQYGE